MNFIRARLISHAGNLLSIRNNCQLKLAKFAVAKRQQQTSLFSTSERRNLSPLVWLLIRPLAKFSAVVVGRGFRKWWQSLPKNRKGFIIGSIKRHKYKLALTFGALGGTGVVYYQMHLQEAPLTQRKRFIAFNSAQIRQLADFQYKALMDEIGDEFYGNNHPVHKRVEMTAHKLIRANHDLPEISGKEWTVTVIANYMQNAFVLPNGHIFVYKGMLDLCDNDDQLGVILGHEMAHAVLGHGAEQISYTHLAELLTIVLVAAIWALIPIDLFSIIGHYFMQKVIEVVLHLPYSRELETEADDIGLRLSAKACFDIRESVTFWKKLHVQETSNGGSENVEWLSTHPNHETRSVALEGKLPEVVPISVLAFCLFCCEGALSTAAM